MQTEFEFELPKGYVDQNGDLHKRGTMRLATAADEILPLRDPRVQQNAGYLTIILLSRVVTRLGSLSTVNTRVIESLFTMDLAYLQDMYQRINMSEMPHYQITCPHCNQQLRYRGIFLLGLRGRALPRRTRGSRSGACRRKARRPALTPGGICPAGGDSSLSRKSARGMSLYPQDRLYQEMAFLAYYLHWSDQALMALDHWERRRWCREVSAINQKLSGDDKKTFELR